MYFRPFRSLILRVNRLSLFAMVNFFISAIAVTVLVCNSISPVRCGDECVTHANCNGSYVCCGGLSTFDLKNKTQRRCTYGSCLHHYCSSDSDCGDFSMCCRSNECVRQGCSGCTKNTDCDSSLYAKHVCCKRTFPFDQTVCAASCIDKKCNSNDDCGGFEECCRSGKCTKTGCRDKCKSNSDCNSNQYCCQKADVKNWLDIGCAQSCVGAICSTREDCGPQNECCISNKCVDRGCSGCTTNSNCSTGHYCCKKREWYELSECSADCIGKSCGTRDDCGGPGEICNSDHRCAIILLPPWLIAVITVSGVGVVLLIAGMLLVVYIKQKKAPYTASTHAGQVPLHNTRYEGGESQISPASRQFSGIANPTYHETTHQNTTDVARPAPHFIYYPQK